MRIVVFGLSISSAWGNGHATLWRRLGVRDVRTGLSWADWCRPGAQAWFDRLMAALAPFRLTVTFCFTPEHMGLAPHNTSPPRDNAEMAAFCRDMIERYAPA